MNGPFQVAQASGTGGSNSGAPPRVFKLTKPLGDQAVVVNLGYDQKVQVDFSSIANEKITLVHIGEKLIILFDNKATVTVEPFFDSRHDALNNLTIEIAPGRDVTVSEFASLFPITDDQSVLPAAGDGNGNAQGSGADFSTAAVDPLAIGNPLDLLGQEELGNFQVGGQQFLVTPTVIIQPTITVAVGPAVALAGVQSLVVDESFIPVIGSQQGPAGSNVATETFAPVFTVTTQTGVQSETFGLTIGNATTNLIDSVSGLVVHLVQIGAGEVDGVVTIAGVQTTVFTLAVDTTGHITMTELRAVHELTPGDFNEGINLGSGMVSLTLTVVDNNNESVSASFDLGPHLTILDDGPSIQVVVQTGEGNGDHPGTPTLTVDESFLTAATNNNTDGTTPDVTQTVKTANYSGSFTSVQGADSATIAYSLGVSAPGVDSGLINSATGSHVFLVVNGNTVEGHVGAANGPLVAFTLSVDATTGVVTLTDLRAVHEPIPGDFNEGISLNSIPNLLTLTATITDKDGDSASASLDLGKLVTFDDDGPILSVTAPAAINGLDFGTFALNGNIWGVGSGTATGTNGGWTIADANQGHSGADLIGNTGSGIVQLERVGDGYEGMHSSTAGFMVDLDASPHDVKISQTITGLVDGQTYDLRFEAGAPFPGDAHLEVWFGGTKVGDIAPTGQMQEFEIALIGGSGADHNNLLEFRETGTPDNQGTFLANVSVGDIVIDETPGIQADSNEVAPNSLFDLVANKGTDPDMPPQFAAGTTAAVTVTANFGADGPLGGSAATGTVYSLQTATQGMDSGLTTTAGQAIHLFNENGFVVGRYDSNNSGGIDGSDNAAFAFRIDPSTGVLSLVQYVSLHQPNTASNDEGVFLNTGVLSVTVTITDADGDSATQTADISANIRFDDDGPTLSVSGSSGTVVVDETPGLQSADGATDVHFTTLSTAAQTAFNGVVNKGHDFDVSSSDLDHGALSYAVGSGSILAAVVNFGADGPAAGIHSEVFALTLPSNGVNSGLKTTEGREIFLFQENGVIVGRYDAPNDGNTTVNQSDPAAFAITIDPATGQISLAQYVSLNHPEQATSADGFVSYNEAVTLASGTISISVTATDGDGDTVTGAADISGAIKFLDDGPTVTVSVDHHFQVVLDETPGVQSEDDDTTSSTVRHLFDSVANTGNDPDVSSADKDHGALGFAIGTNAALDVHAIFGADGPAVHQSEVFSLTLNEVSGSVDSGIQTTEGQEIYLSLENGVIVGRVADGSNHFATSNDPAAFAITVDSTGHVATAEWLSLKHGDPHAFDETVQLATGTVSATVTVTDGDGDQASASADISSKILFEDDAPVAHDVTPNTILDDEAQSLFPPNFGGPGDVSPSLSTVSGGPGTLFDSGADGTKSVTFTPPSGLKAIFELPSGLAGQETVSYATTIVGGHTILTATGDVSHDTVFTLDVSPDGSYTFKVSEPLVDPIHSTTEENLSVKIGFTVTDGDGDQDSGSLTVKVNDDTPTVEVDQAQHDYHDVTLSPLTLDESIGAMAGDPNAATDDVSGVTTPTLLTAVDVTKAIGIISTPTSANGTSVAELFDTTVHFGADGAMAPASFNYSFTLKDDHGNTVSNGSSTGVETNLVVTALAGTPLAGLSDDQRTIYLFKQADGSIVGKIGIGGGGSVPDDIALHIVITGSATDPQITVEQYLPIEHSNHSSSDESTSLTFADHDASLGVTLTVSATDGDGDVATDSKTVSLTDHDNPLIKIEDDGPTVTVSATSATVIHDETPGIQTAADPNPANDVAGASLPTGVLTLFNAITHPGSDPDVTVKDNGAIGFATSASKIVAVTPDFGTDGPAINGSQVLSLQIQGGNNTDSGLQTTNGDHILLRLETYNGVNLIVGRVDGNHDGSVTTADPAAFAIELGQDGNISLAQYLSLKNPLPGSTAADQDEPVLTLQHVQASVTITDGDGDHATQTIDISGNIQFQDDGPTLTVTSPGVINGLDFGTFVLNGDVWGAGSGVATGTNGGWTIADANAGHSGADLIGNTGSGAVQLERVGDGYQGMHSSTDGFMVDLDASPHDVKISQTVNGLAVGQTYDLRFEAGAPFPSDAHLEVWFGGVRVGNFGSLGQMQEFEITLTGGSGDHSNLLEFRETGTPDNQGTYIANVSVGEIVIDETPGIQADSNEVAPNTLFDTVANHGTDPDMPPQFAAGLTAVVSVAANFGADGPATTGATVYSLQTTQAMDSGLTTTAGQAIHLFNENGFVVGRYDSNNSGGIDGSDNAAFAFRVDPSTGVLSLVQYVSLHQPNTASNDEGVFLNTNALSVSVTVTDGDGDTATKSADVSAVIRFDDDGPTALASATVAKAVDEDGLKPPDLSTGNADAGRTGEVLGTGSDTVSGSAGSLNSLVNFGADGPAAHPFQVASQSDATTWISGLHLSSQGSAIDNATVVGNTVTALSHDGRAVFSLTVNDDGSWSFKLLDQLDHPLVDNPATQVHEIAFEDTLTLNLGGLIVATDGDGDSVPLNGGGLQITVLDDVPFFGAISTDTVTHLNTVTTGTFDFHVGADDFPAGTHPVGEFTVTPPTIAGVDVTTTTDPTTGVITLTGTFHDGGATFYVLTVNPNGTYTFALDSQAAGTTTTQTLADVNLEHSFQPEPVKDFGSFSFIADPGHNVNGSGSGVGIDNDHVGNGEHLTIKFDQEMTVADFHLDQTGGDPVLVTWVATDSQNPAHTETGTFIVGHDESGATTFTIDTGGVPFDTLSITPTSDKDNPGDLKGSGQIRFISVGGTEVVQNANTGPLDFTLTGTDFDGDAATGTIHIVTDIHAPPVVSQNLVADEDDLPAGNHDSAPGDEASVLAGHVSYNLGTDHIGSVSLSTTGGLTDLQTLAGQAVDTFWNGSTLIGFVHGTDPSLPADQVFTITVTNTNDTGADYSMTLLQPVKHAISGTEDNTAPFNVNVLVTDSVGGTSSTSFTVVVNDDSPVAVASATVVKAVDEDGLQPPDLSTGNADAGRQGEVPGTGSDSTSGLTGSLNSLVHFGADGPGAHPFQVVGQAAAIAWISGLHLTSQNSLIDNATVVGNTVTALSHDGRAVFSLTVNDDGSWAFKLLDQLDHPLTNNPATPATEIAFEDTLTLNLGGLIVATDGDGDPVTLNGSGLQISVLDDVPFFGTISSATVTHLNTPTSGTFDFHVGADDFPAGSHHVGEFTVTPPTIAGVDVSQSTDPQTGIITVTGTFHDGGATFYVLTVNPNGTYTFALDGQPATTQTLTEVNLPTNFQPAQTVDFGPFSFIADPGNTVNGGGGVGINNDHVGNGEHLTIKFDQEMTVATFHLDPTGGNPIIVTWVATDSHNPGHSETGTFTVPQNGPAFFSIDILAHDGGGNDISQFDTLSITPTSDQNNPGDLKGSGEIRFIGVSGTEITPAVSPGPFDFTLTGTDFDGDAATGTIHIAADIQPPASVSALDAMVSEAGLPPHNSLPAGSGEIADGDPTNNSDHSETTTGTILVTLGDTPSVVTINDVPVTAVGEPIAGAFGTLTITSISATQIGYSYTLNTNTSGDTTHDDFTVKVTDNDNATASATLVVNIVDDVPTAHTDTGSVSEGALLTVNAASGVLFNDVAGADGFAAGGGVVGVAAGSNTSSPVSGGLDTGIAGAHGTLTLHADGSYTYQSTANGITVNTTDTFVYTIKDGDGDLSTTTLTINLSDVTLVANNQTKTVNEAALDNTTTGSDLTHGAVIGSLGTADPGETATGTLAVTGATGYTAQDVTTTHGQFHLNTDGTYIYTLTSPVTESPAANNSTDTVNGVESFVYTAHDANNNTVTGTITINVTDDVPHAVADTWTPTITGATVLTGLLANDSFGADGVDTTNASPGHVTVGSAGHGTVVYNNDGTFTYTPNAGTNGSDSFTYTIKDGDGDTSTATVTLSNIQTNSVPTAGAVTATVDDEGLPGGIAGNGQSSGDVAGQDITASGVLTHNFNTDGKASSDPINFSLMNGVTGTVGTESVTYSWDATSNTLTAVSNAGRGNIFTVVVDGGNDNGNGNYAFTLLKPVMHATGNGENDATVALTYQVKDGTTPTADTATGTLTITINDDTPVTAPSTKTLVEGQTNTNLMLILDVSGSMTDASGLTGLNRLDVLKASVNELFEQYGDLGTVHVQLVTFSTGAQQVGTDWMTIAQAKTFIDGLSANGNTNYDAALQEAMTIFGDSGKVAGAQNVAYFVSDGQPTSGQEIGTADEATWTQFLRDNHIDTFALGAGSGAVQSALDPVAYNGQSSTNTDGVVVTDLSQLAVTLTSNVSVTTGNLVLDGTPGPVGFGADGGHVKSITIEGETYTYDGTGSITATGSGNHGTFAVGTHIETVALASGGKFAVDMDDGSYTYTPPASINANVVETVNFVVVDNDGDTTPSTTLTINITHNDLPPIVRDDHVFTNISGAAIAIPDIALLYNDVDPNGQAITIGSAFTNIVDATSVGHSGATVTFTDNDSDGGSFTYTGSTAAPVGSDTGDVTVTRVTGSTITGDGLDDILIAGTSGTTMNGLEGDDVLIGGSGNDTLNGGAGRDLMVGGAGNDTFNLANGDFAAGESIDGGTGTGDAIVLTNATTVDFTTGTVTNVETLTGSNSSDTVTMSASQWSSFTTINLGGGSSDTLNVTVNGAVDISSSSTIPTVSNTETVHLTGTAGDDTITLSGTQLNALLSGTTNTIDLGGGADTIILTSTSTDLNGLANGNLVNVENVTLAAAATLSLVNQTEAFTITGSSGADTITGGTGADSISAGAGDDVIIVTVSNDILLDGGIGTDTLQVGGNFTSSSDGQIVNIENVTMTTAATLNLANQTEGFKIIGSSGADTITGGSGNDTINAGSGNDTLTGGSGVDQFRLATNTGTDTITDFARGTDKIGFLDGAGTGAVNFATVSTSVGATLGASDFIKEAGLTASDDNKVVVLTTAQANISTATISGATNDYVVVFDNAAGVNRAEIWFDDNWNNTSGRTLVGVLNNVTAADVSALVASDFVVYNSATDPLVLDLGAPGIAFSSVQNGVQFDINGDGIKDQVAWTVGGQDGILAIDLNGSGKIESGNELFTPTFNGGHFANGIAALASLDANHDGVIDAKDPAFSQLLVWQDANHNGISDAGELTKLSDLDITSINLTPTAGASTIDGQAISSTGSFTYTDGSNGSFVEANLDASLGKPAALTSAQHHDHAHTGHGMPGADALKLPEGAAASIVADFHHNHGNIDLSSLGQPAADHHQHHEPHGQGGGEHHLAAASMPMPAAIALMHEEAHRAAQAAHH